MLELGTGEWNSRCERVSIKNEYIFDNADYL